jgi:hypothetical protein
MDGGAAGFATGTGTGGGGILEFMYELGGALDCGGGSGTGGRIGGT